MVMVAVGLLVFGAVRLPLEHAVNKQHRDAYFRGAELGLDMREQIGQLAYLAALSGFRSIVADMLWIKAYTAWERTEWGKMALLFNNVTALQPRVLMFWDMSAWHMAWNASVAALDDESLGREAVRVRAQRQYFDLGRDFLERGIRNNPDRWGLYEKHAMLLRDKYMDHCGAAESYAKAAAFEDAPSYMRRFAAYELSKCEGREREAYEMLRDLYDEGEKQHLPTLLTRLEALEEQLQIPVEERRVYNRQP